MTEASTATRRSPPTWSRWVRQAHRRLSIAFTVVVAANFAALALGEPPDWLYLLPLPPLALLLLSGLCMFALPHAERWRRARGAGGWERTQ